MSAIAIAVMGIGFIICMSLVVGVVDRAQDRQWRRLAAERRQLNNAGEYRLLDEYWGRDSSKGSRLLLRLAQIETAASIVLDREFGRETRQLFQIRSELRRLGCWSESDVALFDQAMKVRNVIVHDGGSDLQFDDTLNQSLLHLLNRIRRPEPVSDPADQV